MNILTLKSRFDTALCTFLISRCVVVSGKYSGSKMITVKSEYICKQFPAPLASFFLEVIPETPASHHLKKSNMGSVSHRIYIVCTDAPLNIAKPCTHRMLLTEKIRHQRLHSRNIKHNSGRAVRYEGYRTNVLVPSCFIEFFPCVSEFF